MAGTARTGHDDTRNRTRAVGDRGRAAIRATGALSSVLCVAALSCSTAAACLPDCCTCLSYSAGCTSLPDSAGSDLFL
eukprot:2190543-Rhodomonas_salina.1